MKEFIQSKNAKLSFMITGLVAVAVVLFFVVANSNITATAKGPKIVFKETVHDFGKVPQGPSIQYNFKFTNKGGGVLKIVRVQTTCGCTGANVGEKTEYAKNESGEIKVEFNTQGRQGPQEKAIIVYTNDPDNEQVSLKVKCDIDPNMQF